MAIVASFVFAPRSPLSTFTRSSPKALGTFYNSTSYASVDLTIVSYQERAETLCGSSCPAEIAASIKRDYQFPLIHKLTLRLPQALIHRTGGTKDGLATVVVQIWASDGLPLRAPPEGLDVSQANSLDVENAIQARTQGRRANGDWSVQISITSNHLPLQMMPLEDSAHLLQAARQGHSCKIDYVNELKLYRIFGLSATQLIGADCNADSNEQTRIDCLRRRDVGCSWPAARRLRGFARVNNSDQVQYFVHCGSGSVPRQSVIDDPDMLVQIDPLTDYWRAYGRVRDLALLNQFGGPLCKLVGNWGGWRFEVLVDRTRPEDWDRVHDHVKRLYDRYVVQTDGIRPDKMQ